MSIQNQRKSPVVQISQSDIDAVDEFRKHEGRPAVLKRSKPEVVKRQMSSNKPGPKRFKTNYEIIVESPIIIENATTKTRCFVCRSAKPRDFYKNARQLADNSRFELYATLVRVLDFNHGLPNADHIDEDLHYCCTICFKAVNALWEFHQQIETIRAQMNEVVEKLRVAIKCKSPVSLEENNSGNTSNYKNHENEIPNSDSDCESVFVVKNEVAPIEDVCEDFDNFDVPFIPEVDNEELQINSNARIQRDEADDKNIDDDYDDNVESDAESDEYDSEFELKIPKGSKSQSKNRRKRKKQSTKDEQPLPHACDICPKKFNFESLLYHHKRQIHEMIRNFICPTCTYGFYRKIEYERHLKTHREDRPHHCSDCGKSFTQEEILSTHKALYCKTLKKIEKAKPECTICGITFVQIKQQKKHMLEVHNIRKPFKCGLCEVSCSSYAHLYRHKIVVHEYHDNVKLFACAVCEYRFLRKNDMERHQKTHTPDKPFHCRNCGKSFAQEERLALHQERNCRSLKPKGAKRTGKKARPTKNQRRQINLGLALVPGPIP